MIRALKSFEIFNLKCNSIKIGIIIADLYMILIIEIDESGKNKAKLNKLIEISIEINVLKLKG